jgi:hypothetical protein
MARTLKELRVRAQRANGPTRRRSAQRRLRHAERRKVKRCAQAVVRVWACRLHPALVRALADVEQI